MQRLLILLVVAAFGVLTGVALWQHGFIGNFQLEFQTSAGLQVLADLAIALVLLPVWLCYGARATGRTRGCGSWRRWPWARSGLWSSLAAS